MLSNLPPLQQRGLTNHDPGEGAPTVVDSHPYGKHKVAPTLLVMATTGLVLVFASSFISSRATLLIEHNSDQQLASANHTSPPPYPSGLNHH